MNITEQRDFERESEALTNFFIDGVEYDKSKKFVWFTDKHEKSVDTSDITNPTSYTLTGYTESPVNVISIFKRNRDTSKEGKRDGNPLLYALKNKDGWELDSNSIPKLMRRFVKIAKQLNKQVDTVVEIPTSGSLNKEFYKHLKPYISSSNYVSGVFGKLSAYTIWDNMIYLVKVPEKQLEVLHEKFQDMYDNNEGRFEFKFIPPELRKYIVKIYDSGEYEENEDDREFDYIGKELKFAPKINGKDILVLDDTVTSGQTISLFCENLLRLYDPKSVTVITIFSSLDAKDVVVEKPEFINNDTTYLETYLKESKMR